MGERIDVVFLGSGGMSGMNDDSFDFDKFRDECGVFGIFGYWDVVHMMYLGLYVLQYRGQESVGIVVSTGGRLKLSWVMGYVSDVFGESVLDGLGGEAVIGHVWYFMFGDSRVVNA